MLPSVGDLPSPMMAIFNLPGLQKAYISKNAGAFAVYHQVDQFTPSRFSPLFYNKISGCNLGISAIYRFANPPPLSPLIHTHSPNMPKSNQTCAGYLYHVCIFKLSILRALERERERKEKNSNRWETLNNYHTIPYSFGYKTVFSLSKTIPNI